MTLPFRLSSLPPRTTPFALIESLQAKKPVAAVLLEVAGDKGSQTMQISNVIDDSYADGPVEKRTLAAGRVELRSASQTICFPTRSDPVCVTGPGDEPASDWAPDDRTTALRTAQLLVPVDDPADSSTWLDADTAMP